MKEEYHINIKLRQIQNWLELAQKSKWSVSGLAEICHVSMRTLELYFFKRFHQAPKPWLIAQRQKQAARLLCDGCLVKEAATMLGYKHFNHFSRDFKRYWGKCPTQINTKVHGAHNIGNPNFPPISIPVRACPTVCSKETVQARLDLSINGPGLSDSILRVDPPKRKRAGL